MRSSPLAAGPARARRPRHVPARFRILAQPFARAVSRCFEGLPHAVVAARLGISRPTLRKLLRADGVVNLATVERLEIVLREPRLGFATATVDPARRILPAITERPAGRVDALLHAFGRNPLLAGFLAQVGVHVHWQAHIHDRRRPYRQRVAATGPWPAAGAYARFVLDARDRPIELALSFQLRGTDELDLAIDYGLLHLTDAACRTWELIARRGTTTSAPAGPTSFLTWLPGHDAELLVRSDRPCVVRHVETLDLAAGEAQLDRATAGFRAMGFFHVASPPPWRAD